MLLAGSALAWSATFGLAQGRGNFIPGKSLAWSGNIGWLDWRSPAGGGVIVDPFVCSGFVYAANVGWIDMGSGAPENGVAYQNNSPTDFGVNLTAAGELRGLAYGANIGWINFEPIGQPRFDLGSGRLSGFAYSANVGWISLSDATNSLMLDHLASGRDVDSDEIPDAWEFRFFPSLGFLEASKDRDGDGLTDLDEYLADTDPTDKADHLRITGLSFSAARAVVTWTSRSTRLYKLQFRVTLDEASGWSDVSPDWLPAEGGRLSQEFATDEAGEQRYFRVRSARPLSP